jgi:hypothetical protein
MFMAAPFAITGQPTNRLSLNHYTTQNGLSDRAWARSPYQAKNEVPG